MTPVLALLIAGPWGVAVGLHPDAAIQLDLDVVPDLGEVVELGSNAVLLPVVWSQAEVDSTTIQPTSETIHDKDLVRAFRSAAAEGLAVTLMPYVTLSGGEQHDWRGVLRPNDEERWWRSYRRMIIHYARIAEDEGAKIFVIGSELSTLQDRPSQWSDLAVRVRQVYSGSIAYVTNHDMLDRPAPFDVMDIAGVSAYFPLSTSVDASAEELASSWDVVSKRLLEFRGRVGRPLVLFEIGYASIDGAAIAPWDDTVGAPIDLEEQRRLYRAAGEALREAPHVDGAFFWGWFGAGGRHDRTFTPRAKPAQRELERLLLERVHTRTGRSASYHFENVVFSEDFAQGSRCPLESKIRGPCTF